MSTDSFHNFWLPFCEENQKNVLLASMKIVPVNSLQGACSGFPSDFKSSYTSSCDPEN
jgi:hypothetical protein